MQHDYVTKKLNFDLLTSSPEYVCVCVCMCVYVCACVCGGWGVWGSAGKIIATMLVHSSFT